MSKLLIETHKSVSQIGLECGCNSLSNFNRQFRKAIQAKPIYLPKDVCR
ncbi:hypothetical protein FFF34_006670 [Inquilinus sp. KBS0705]|nr:hypothetical protein FFF34_006670 [Inquilinus sp. KBS0705]